MANMTPTTHATAIPEVWSAQVRKAVESNLTAAKLVVREFDGEIQQYGDIVHIPHISNFTAADKTAGTAVTYQATTETETTVTIDKHKVVPFLIEDITKVQAKPDLMAHYTGKAGYGLAKAVDTDVLGLYSGFSQSVGADGTDVSNANFVLAIQYLDLADAPETNRSGIFTAGQKSQFLEVDQFVRYDATGMGGQQNPIISGQFGELYGVKIFFSTNVTTTGSPSGDHNLVFHKEAMILAMQRDVRIQSQYSVDDLGTKVVADVLYGVSEYRDTFCVVYKT